MTSLYYSYKAHYTIYFNRPHYYTIRVTTELFTRLVTRVLTTIYYHEFFVIEPVIWVEVFGGDQRS